MKMIEEVIMKPRKKQMSMRKIIFPFIILAAFILTVNPVFASQKRGMEQSGISTEGIELSNEQRERLLDAREAYIDKTIRLEANEAISRNKEDRILAGDKISFQELREHVKASSEAMAQIDMAEVDALEEINTILNTDQWKWYIRNLRAFENEWLEAEMMEGLDGHDEGGSTELPEIPCGDLLDFTPFSLLLD